MLLDRLSLWREANHEIILQQAAAKLKVNVYRLCNFATAAAKLPDSDRDCMGIRFIKE